MIEIEIKYVVIFLKFLKLSTPIVDKNKNVYTWFEETLNRSGVSCGCLSRFL